MNEQVKDILERLGATFVQSFIGALTVAAVIDGDIGALEAAAVAGVADVLVVVKELAKRRLRKLGPVIEPGA